MDREQRLALYEERMEEAQALANETGVPVDISHIIHPDTMDEYLAEIDAIPATEPISMQRDMTFRH